jgi:hypothetical protein
MISTELPLALRERVGVREASPYLHGTFRKGE